MVKRILRIFNTEFRNVNEAALLLGALTLLSQLLGLFRDKALAHFIGPGGTLDVYYAAFRIPDLLYVSIGSLVSITVLIPFLLERMRDGEATPEAKHFLSDMFTAFMAVVSFAALGAFFLMPYLAHVVAPGFTDADTTALVATSRLMLLSPILLGISNLFGTVTQLYRRFFIFSLSPVFYNLGILAGIIFLYPRFGMIGLAWGVAIGSLLHVLLQIPTVLAHGFLPRLGAIADIGSVQRAVLVSLPRTLALSLNNLALLVILSLASTLGAGAISVFNLSYNLQSVPLAIIGVSYSVAAFPTLARFFTGGRTQDFIDNIVNTSRQIIFWTMPIVFLFIVLRAQIVRVILGSGLFSWSDTRLVAASLALFAVSLVAQNLNLLFVRAYYAAGKTKKPLSINVAFSIAIIALAVGLVWLYDRVPGMRYFTESLLRVSSTPGSIMLMLPLAYSLGTIGNTFSLWRSFKRDFSAQSVSLERTFFQSLLASFMLSITTYAALALFGSRFDINTFWGIFAQGVFAGSLGMAVWIAALMILGNREFKAVTNALRRKFWKTDVVAPEQTDLQP